MAGPGERVERRWNCEAESIRRLEIDHKFEFRRLLDGKIGRFLTLEDSRDIVASDAAGHGVGGRIVAHQTAGAGKARRGINCGQFVERSQRQDLLDIRESESTENHCVGPTLNHLGQSRLVVAIVATFDNHDFHAKGMPRGEHCSRLPLVCEVIPSTR